MFNCTFPRNSGELTGKLYTALQYTTEHHTTPHHTAQQDVHTNNASQHNTARHIASVWSQSRSQIGPHPSLHILHQFQADLLFAVHVLLVPLHQHSTMQGVAHFFGIGPFASIAAMILDWSCANADSRASSTLVPPQPLVLCLRTKSPVKKSSSLGARSVQLPSHPLPHHIQYALRLHHIPMCLR